MFLFDDDRIGDDLFFQFKSTTGTKKDPKCSTVQGQTANVLFVKCHNRILIILDFFLNVQKSMCHSFLFPCLQLWFLFSFLVELSVAIKVYFKYLWHTVLSWVRKILKRGLPSQGLPRLNILYGFTFILKYYVHSINNGLLPLMDFPESGNTAVISWNGALVSQALLCRTHSKAADPFELIKFRPL